MAARINGVSVLCLTGLSMLQGMPSIPVCIGYQHRGEMVEILPSSRGSIEELQPVYRDFPGFNGPIEHCHSFGALPPMARALIDFVEEQIAPVRWVCVGKRRDQVLEQGVLET
jgi:adenylosuccinate synthase